MKYTHLGRTGLEVSRLCLGTMNFGPRTDESTSFTLMDRALEAGINFFDTANVYGRPISAAPGDRPGHVGLTEEIIGRWLVQGGGRREKVVLATKVYGRMGDWPNQSRLSARHIRQACEDSLRRLQTDHLDLYQMHHVDRSTPWEEVWQAMEQLVREGKVLYVGSSNFAGWHIAQACETARSRHFFGLVSEQSLYNLTERTVELEVLPACEAYGLGFIPWSPLGSGLLGGVLGAEAKMRRSGRMVQEELEKFRPGIEGYEALCRELGLAPATVALAWLLHQPVVTAPIIGPRTIEQLTGPLEALDVTLSDDVLARLDELFPGPGGPAPEAYAW
jgi:aryl-alcohol dehydrogenase-like predicted oxidoreductase